MKYRYTVYIDDSSKLCGYAAQVFEGEQSMMMDGELIVRKEDGTFASINWSRVRWYTCEPIEEEPA